MNENAIALDEFVAYVKNHVDFDDEDSIRAVEPYLRKLNNNKDLLCESICNEIRKSSEFQPGNTYQATSYILYKDDDFIVRAVCWLPENKRKFTDTNIDRGLLVFSVPHDHDFSFLTIGHHGPGYYSGIYEYDYDSVLGECDEFVKLSKLEFTRLNQDSIFFFRAGRDLHIQMPPDELSISLNFMIRKRGKQRYLDQFWFDIDNQKIKQPLENDTYWRAKSIDLISALMGEACFDSFYEVKDSHRCRRTRIRILQTLEKLKPEMKEEIWRNALADKDMVVRNAANHACI